MWTASRLYGAAVAVRNRLYDLGIIRSHSFDIPVICVGNITAGGTGKTPHVIWLAEKLSALSSVSVLSRGYLRKSSGFMEVKPDSTAAETGDEPLLMARSLTGTRVFVDRDRVNGIREIIRTFPETGTVVMDDGFQHRAVKAGLYIILTDWGRLMTRDRLLPLGLLRESVTAVKRADVVIVTKTPPGTSPEQMQAIRKELYSAGAGESVFFTEYAYGKPLHLFGGDACEINGTTSILLVTGIANPAPLTVYLGNIAGNVIHLSFPDHHAYTDADLEKITSAFDAISSTYKIIVTTAKDGVRLKEITNIADRVRQALHYLPVRVQFIENEDVFLNKVYSYAGKDHQDR